MKRKFENFNQIGDRQRRRRISLLRRNMMIHDEGDGSSSSSGMSDNLDIPLLVERVQNDNTNIAQEEQDELGDDNFDNERDEEAAESSDGETVSSHEEESEEECHEQFFNDAENEERDDTDDSSSDEDLNIHFQEDIAAISRRKMKNAFLSAGLSHKQGNVILKTLRENPFRYHQLPKDSRTLLNTPTFVASRLVHEVAGGKYLHIGFKNGLLKKLELIPDHQLPQFLLIDFSSDGGALDIGGKWQFWPHQFRVFNIPDKRPMIAGVFKGRHKPSNAHEFYDPFITEINEVIENGGIVIRGRTIPLRIRCFIADAPARAMILNHYSHNSSKACSKCKVEGHRCELAGYRGTMVFLGVEHTPRTDEEYLNRSDEDHHRGPSPLSLLPMGLVSRVPFESMHLLDIGNVKKVFRAHVDGKYICRRLSGRQLNILDARMIALIRYCPTEFGRRPREISSYGRFKATEFRQILLYTAVAVLKDVFPAEYYSHFMILHCVIRLLMSEGTNPVMYDFCEQALKTYVRMCEILYGEPFISYNVHGLLHIVDDVRTLGPLQTFSAYCYENNMPEFKKHVRKPHLPLQQYCKRMFELSDFAHAPIDDGIHIQPTQSHNDGPLLEHVPQNCRQFRKIVIGKSTFAINLRDNCFVSRKKKIGLILNIVKVDENIVFVVKYFRAIQEIYDVGVTSESVGVYHCSNLSDEISSVLLADVDLKCYRMPKWSYAEGREEDVIENEWICVTLLTPVSVPQN